MDRSAAAATTSSSSSSQRRRFITAWLLPNSQFLSLNTKGQSQQLRFKRSANRQTPQLKPNIVVKSHFHVAAAQIILSCSSSSRSSTLQSKIRSQLWKVFLVSLTPFSRPKNYLSHTLRPSWHLPLLLLLLSSSSSSSVGHFRPSLYYLVVALPKTLNYPKP